MQREVLLALGEQSLANLGTDSVALNLKARQRLDGANSRVRYCPHLTAAIRQVSVNHGRFPFQDAWERAGIGRKDLRNRPKH